MSRSHLTHSLAFLATALVASPTWAGFIMGIAPVVGGSKLYYATTPPTLITWTARDSSGNILAQLVNQPTYPETRMDLTSGVDFAALAANYPFTATTTMDGVTLVSPVTYWTPPPLAGQGLEFDKLVFTASVFPPGAVYSYSDTYYTGYSNVQLFGTMVAPEPSTASLLVIGCIVALVVRRR
jgi:hypothetical protein